ncbi:MAG: AzlC family ABC transporter permease [Synergistaceae bacterium]|jgi:4-azaleucine resistance transporter AzlC|nr:AzlC family ABC transporter permease [Synergistaceae bacterium]
MGNKENMQKHASVGFSQANPVLRGAKRSLPVLLGFMPVGMAYGLLAQQLGLGLWDTAGMSLFVFAGASQLMALSMLHGGASVAAIVGATFVINFRHVLMAASLSPMLRVWSKWHCALLGGMLTDESFAIHSVCFAEGDTDPAAAISLNCVIYVAWTAAGCAGYMLGTLIERPEAWGINFALPAMFIGLLMSMLDTRGRPALIAALCGGAVSVALVLAGAESWATLLGALAGASAGYAKGEA